MSGVARGFRGVFSPGEPLGQHSPGEVSGAFSPGEPLGQHSPGEVSGSRSRVLSLGEIRVVIALRGATDADDRGTLTRLARQASGIPTLTLSRRCAHCGSNDHGRPQVRGLFVSLSRSSDTVAFAISREPVGIDIESMKAIARADIDSLAFTRAELVRIAVSTAPDRLRAELWTGKEAVLKLRGTGLRVEPASIELADVAEALHPFTLHHGLVGAVHHGLVGAVAGAGRMTLVE